MPGGRAWRPRVPTGPEVGDAHGPCRLTVPSALAYNPARPTIRPQHLPWGHPDDSRLQRQRARTCGGLAAWFPTGPLDVDVAGDDARLDVPRHHARPPGPRQVGRARGDL